MDFNKKKKRRTRSVQDMYGIGSETRPSQRSSGSARAMSHSNYTYRGNDISPSGGPGLLIFAGLLILAIIVAIIFYVLRSDEEPFVYPTGVITINGVLTDIYAGNSTTADSLTGDAAATMADAGATPADGTVPTDGTAATPQASGDLAVPTGGSSSYPEATTHTELVTQFENALSVGDNAFVAGRLICKDASGNLSGYPTEAIDAFIAYLSANPDKRTAFVTAIGDEALYSAVQDGVYYVALPKCVANIEIGYADTTVSMSTFADTVVDGVTPLERGPLLPMDYSFTISNPAWPNPVSQNIPVDLGKTNIPIKVSAN